MKKKTDTATRWANINNRQTIQDQSIQGLSCKCLKGETKRNEQIIFLMSIMDLKLCYVETEHMSA